MQEINADTLISSHHFAHTQVLSSQCSHLTFLWKFNPSNLSCSAPSYQQQSRAEHNKNDKNGAGMLVIIGACKDLFFGGDKG